MIDNPLSPEEQAIVRQIQAVPKLELGPTARAAIRERMLSEFRVVSQQNTTNAAAQTRQFVLTTTVIVVITVVVIIVLAILASQNTPQSATATPLIPSVSPQASTATEAAPSATSTPSASETINPDAPATIQEALIDVETVIPSPGASLTLTTTIAPATSTATQPPATQSASASPSDTAAPTLDSLIVIEGPVINIVNNIITIYDFDIEVEPNHPILNLIQIGDVVHIEGAYGSTGTVVAAVVSNLSDMRLATGASVSLEGPVESINGNIIVVNSISVQLAANDPLLQTVQVGQFVRVQGNFQNNNGVFVLVVVNIVVINVNTGGGGGNDGCWYHDDGMGMGMGMGMGHWHCDGMGMGSKKS